MEKKIVFNPLDNTITPLLAFGYIMLDTPRMNRMYPLIVSLVVFLVVGSAHFAFAEIRIATVDINRILNESKEAKAKRTELDSLSQTAKKKVESRRTTLKELETNLKNKGVSQDSKEVQDFRSQARDFSRFIKDTDEDLKQQFLKINKVLTEKAVSLVEQYAKTNKIDLVLDKSASERGPVLFGNSGADVTDDIIRQMNK